MLVIPSNWLKHPRLALLALALALPALALAADEKQLLSELPAVWAKAATVGDVDKLVGLYDPQAFIHVVFTKEELHGEQAIRAYYAKYEQHPPKVSIVKLEESSIFNGAIGTLAGTARVEFPGQAPMTTRFSIVGQWHQDHWLIQIQTTSKVE